MSRIESFWNILLTSKEYWKNFFDTWHKIYHDVEEYFAMCTWMNDNDG